MLRGHAFSVPAPIPQPRVRPVLGNLPDVGINTPIQSLMRLSRQHGEIYRLTFPAHTLIVIGSHALVDQVSDEQRFDKFIHRPLENIRDFAGDGLFTAHTDEPNWGRAHRILMPAFGPAAMRSYFDAMVDIADQMLTKWERLGPEVDIEVTDNMTRLTLDTIALCGFGYRFNSYYQREMHPFVESMVRALAESGARAKRLPLQTRMMLLTRRQYESDVAFMHNVVDELVAERRSKPESGEARDLLGLMLKGRDPQTGEGLDDVNVRNQMVTFLIAGHETTSGLLSFTLHQLLQHPDVLARVRDEVARVLGDGAPRFEQLAQLTYLDQVLRESLRVWPTAPAYAVYPKEDVALGGRYDVPKGAEILILTPMLHRDPAVWGDPERFDPDRFAPERRDAIPINAWKPFGHGQRACIGRPFAMQEATLALAMMLQRFDIVGKPGYQLKVKETLTLKPDGLTIRARLRKPVSRAVATAAPMAAKPAAASPSARVEGHGTPLLVLFGSNSGSSEAFARRIASDAIAQGYAAEVAAMDERAGALPTEGGVLIVTASYNGLPPDNAKRFCEWLDGLDGAALRGVRYAVFGCGNRDWSATYQAIPKRVDAALAAAGAERLVGRGEADARADFFGDFEGWYAPLLGTLGSGFGVDLAAAQKNGLYEVEALAAAEAPLLRQHGLQLATVSENRELVDMSSPLGRSKRHLELQLPDGVSYQAGDYLVVLPENHPELVARAARRFGLAEASIVKLRATRAGAASLPIDQPISVGELLGRYVELGTPATRKQVEELAAATPCPPEKARLMALAEAERYRSAVLDKRVSVLDLVEENQSCGLSFAAFLEMLPPMRPRQYSISSSPRWDAARCTLTVAIVDAPAWSGRGRYRGTCSAYLSRLLPGDRVAVTVRAPHTPLHPPASLEVPMILIAAGTGLAPFRGFVQERALRQKAEGPAGETLFFFGCDHPDVDFLYRGELGAWQAEGAVEVLPAFFRAPQGEVMFVQHRLWQERARVSELLARGAYVFVCGDGARMAPAVRETLGRIHQEAAGCSDEQAGAWLTALELDGRYVADVFG